MTPEEMTTDERALKDRAHGVGSTPRVDKAGIESVADEPATHPGERRGTELRETRAHTATYH